MSYRLQQEGEYWRLRRCWLVNTVSLIHLNARRERSGLAQPKNTSPAIHVVNIIQLNIDKQTFSLASALSQSYRSSLPLITHSFAAMFHRGGSARCNFTQTAPAMWLLLIQALNKLDSASTSGRQHVWPEWKSIGVTLCWFLHGPWMTVGKMPHHLEGRLCRPLSSNWSAALQNNL